MKLYLSSYRIPDPQQLLKLIGKLPTQVRVAIIPNAKDYYADRARNIKINASIVSFNEIGINDTEVVDLRTIKDKKLNDKLKHFDLIWVIGGNTFCLMEEVVNSGFEKSLKELLKTGVVYGGESAGAVIAGNTLSGVEFADEPEFAEKVYWQGMNLIDNIIVPHVDSEFYGAGIQELINIHSEKTNLIKLTDDQALIVHDDNFEIVG